MPDASFGHRYVYFLLFSSYILILLNVLLHKAGDDENGQDRRREGLETLLAVGVFLFIIFFLLGLMTKQLQT